MNFKEQVKKYVISNALVIKLTTWSKKIALPGFEGVPIFDVASFFSRGLFNYSIQIRARSLAFSFFMAIFPALIFIFTLLPFLPVANMQEYLLMFLKDMMPESAFLTIQDTVSDLLNNKNGSLLSFGFFFTLYLAADGIYAMMSSFNEVDHIEEKRSALRLWGISFLLVFILTLLLLVGAMVFIFSGFVLDYLLAKNIITDSFIYYLLLAAKWGIIVAVILTAISSLYYFGPNGSLKFKFISAGSTLTTILIIVVSNGFAYYVNNFGNYNKLYSSIGTVIVLMLWIHLNVLVILLGYQLNASIYAAKSKGYSLFN